ncbi:MAG: hypothetical protein ACOH5I_09695 [Oligoflexus sp.]
MRLRIHNSIIILTSLVWPVLGCKATKPDSHISLFIAENCAQHPINFYFHEVDKGTQIYTYGPNDAEFRRFMGELQKNYRIHGKDISGQQKIEVVGRFLPNYIETCQQFFQPFLEECAEFPSKSPAFNHCLAKHNRAYEDALRYVMKKSGPERVNLDSISLTHHPQRSSETDQVH